MASIIHVNISSLRKHLFTLNHYAQEHNPDLILLNETHYDPGQPDLKITGYQTVARHDNHDGSGGTAIYAKNDLDTSEIETSQLNLDCCAILLSLPNIGQLAVISQYYKPYNEYNISESDFTYFTNQYQNCLFMGDYNAHNGLLAPTNSNYSNNRGRQLHQIISNNNFSTLNNLDQPTRVDPGTGLTSIIDFAISTSNLLPHIDTCHTGEDVGSDHLPLHVNLLNHTRPQYPQSWIRDFKKANWVLFRTAVNEAVLQLHPGPLDTEDAMDRFIENLHDAITSALDTACPKKLHRPHSFTVSPETLNLIRLKRKARRLLQRNPHCAIHKHTYNSLTRRVSIAIAQEKRNKWHEVCSKLDYRNGASFWKLFNQLSGRKPGRTLTKLTTPSGHTTSSNHQTASTFAEHLAKVHQTHEGPEFNSQNKDLIDDFIHTQPHLFTPQFIATREEGDDHQLLEPVTAQDITNVLKSVKNTSPGDDAIGYVVLKQLPQAMLQYLADMFNYLKSVGYYPKPWKNALGVMIPKPNKDPKIPGNYRPISLLRCLGKIFEKVITKPLIEHLQIQGLLNKWQRAYLPKKEANEHIYRLVHHMKTAAFYGWKGAAIFLDVEKAFDSVWQNGLRYKLTFYKLPHKIIRLLSSYLDNRSIAVRVGSSISESVKLRAGTPQGSVLSPLLFNLYVNDLPFPVDSPVQISQYADDLALWVTCRGTKGAPKQIHKLLSEALANLEQWCSDWHIKINATKSQLLHFPRYTCRDGDQPHFTLFNTIIPRCTEAKFLGLKLNTTLSLIPHCLERKKQAYQRINLLRRVRGTTWGANTATLIHLYKTFIRPVLETGYVGTTSASVSATKHLRIAETKALRCAVLDMYIPGQRRTTNEEIYQIANIECILDRLPILKQKALNRYAGSPLLTDLQHHTQRIRRLKYPMSKPRGEYPLT